MSILFNSVSLESVADVQIEDIRVSPIQYNPVVRPRAIRAGSDFVRNRSGERQISISFALLDSNMETRQAAINSINQWARSDAEFALELPMDSSKVLYCVCTQKPSPSVRQWFENKLKIVFTCFDNPFWTDKTEKTASFGTAFTVGGDAPPMMKIERTLSSAASNQSYSDGTNTMTFSQIPAGNMVIDLNRQTAAVGSSSIMDKYTAASRFIVPKTGQITLTGTGSIKYRERWE